MASSAARVAAATGHDTHAVLVLTRSRVHRKDRRNEERVTVLSLDRLNRHLRRMPGVLTADEIDAAAAHTAAIAAPAPESAGGR